MRGASLKTFLVFVAALATSFDLEGFGYDFGRVLGRFGMGFVLLYPPTLAPLPFNDGPAVCAKRLNPPHPPKAGRRVGFLCTSAVPGGF